MITYTLYEGKDSNDNDRVTDFKSKAHALAVFKKTSYAYAVIHAYEGDDYVATIAEYCEVK